jgi:predicted regulator of Ras-like GTPase activity (Roadblock/LC7/MglB family)
MGRTKSVIPPALVEGLRGSLAQTNVVDLLQFLHTSGKTGELSMERWPDQANGCAYFSAGSLVHAAVGKETGIDALVEICTWDQGSFRFSDDVLSPNVTLTLPLQHTLMEVMRIQDENQDKGASPRNTRPERREGMAQTRSSTDVLEDFLRVPGVTAAVVVGRDGFMIEAAGGTSSVSVDDLGAALAHAVNGIEEMGQELEIKQFQDLFVEYGRAVIMCRPVGDAIIAVVAPDASKLGIIRHKVKPLVEELADLF